MTAQSQYITSILNAFYTYLELQGVISDVREEALLLLLQYLEKKQDFNTWTADNLRVFLENTPDGSKFSSHPKQLVRQFVTEYPPYQANVLLHEYLLALKDDGCSQSTIKNYRSDINQFLQFSNQTLIKQAIEKPKVVDFLRYQKQKGLKKTSVRRKLVSITQFAQWLTKSGTLTGSLTWLNELSDHLEGIDNWAATTKQHSNINLSSQPDTKDLTWSMPLPQEQIASPTSTPANTKKVQRGTAQSHQEFRTRLKKNLSALSSRVDKQTQNKLLPYVNTAMLVLFILGGAFFGYQQFIKNAETPFAYPGSLTRPNRTLSFQGRLTDAARNPITTATNVRFKLYDSGPSTTGGNILWNSGACSVDPDQDGIFSSGLGDDCGTEITEDVFTENSNVWLQVEIDNGASYEVLDPRQSIKTVPYALNSETLQGYPPADPATENTVLVMDENGDVNLGSTNPDLKASSGTFTIEAQSLTLQTTSGSDGDIVLAPDGTGQVSILSDAFLSGYLTAPGATISGTYAGGKPLVVNGVTGQTANLSEWNDGDGNVTVVDEDGRIGIGTDNPESKLQINDSNQTISHLRGTSNFGIYTTDVQAVDTGGSFALGGYIDDAQSSVRNFGVITGRKENSTTGNQRGYISLHTLQDGSLVETMRLDSNGRVGIGVSPSYKLDVSGDINLTGALRASGDAGASGYLLTSSGGGAVTWTDPSSIGGSGSGYWEISAGTIYPINATTDMLVGGTATSSAKFAVLNVNDGTPTASASAGVAGATYFTADGNLATTAMQQLTLGGSTTGAIQFKPNNQTGLYIAQDGEVAIGNTDPQYGFDVTGTGRFTGTLALDSVATVSDNNFVLTRNTSTNVIEKIDSTNWDKDSSDDYQYWVLQANSLDDSNISDGTTVSFDDGTDTTISKTGTSLSINNSSTLESVTGRGATSSNAITLSAAGTALDISTGNLSVAGTGTFGTNTVLSGSGTSYFNGGSVAIGNTSASYNLDVTGTGRFTSTLALDSVATVTDNNLVLTRNAATNVVEKIDTTLWDKDSTDDVGGSGTQNYLTKWDATGQSIQDSQIFDNGTNIGFGTNIPTQFIDIEKTYSDSSGSQYGIQADIINTGGGSSSLTTAGFFGYNSTATTGNIYGVYGDIDVSANADSAYAATFNNTIRNSATVSSARGVSSSLDIQDAGTTITNLSGFYVENNYVAGTITNYYGLYIEDLGTATNEYGIYQAGTNDTNYFAGNVGIGTASPSDKLTLAGGDAYIYDSASLGAEKVSNKSFATSPDTAWVWGTGWTHDTVSDEADHAAGNTAALEQNISAIAGEMYQIVFTVSNRTAGSVTVEVGGVSGSAVSSNTTSTQTIIATGTGNLKFTPSSDFDGTIDDVSVKLVSGGNLKLAGLLTGGGTDGVKVTASGKVGVGTTTPISKFHVSNEGNDLTGKALGMFDQYEGEDIITASSSAGTTRTKFKVDQYGAVTGGKFMDLTNNQWFLDPAAGGISLTVDGKIGVDTTNPEMPIEIAEVTNGIATSGSTPIGGFRIQGGSPMGNVTLDMGIAAGSGTNAWLQATDVTDFTTHHDLLLNPNGGVVGIGTVTPDTNYSLHVESTTNPQMKVGYDATNYATLGVNSAGITTLDSAVGNLVLETSSTTNNSQLTLSESRILLNPLTGDNSAAYVDLFRDTITTNTSSALRIFQGDGTATVNAAIYPDDGRAYFAGNMGVGTSLDAAVQLDVLGAGTAFKFRTSNTGSAHLGSFYGAGDEGQYEWVGWYSGVNRAGIFLWDGTWSGCSDTKFCIIGDSHQLMLASNTGNVLIDDALEISSSVYVAGNQRFNSSGALIPHTVSSTSKFTNLNADLLDGLNSSQFIRNDVDNTVTSYTNQITFPSNSWMHSTSSQQASLQVYGGNGTGTDAFMQFHVGGDYAVYFGLDGGINDLAVGGWSMGGANYRVWHAGNDGSGSGLDADIVDTLHASQFIRSDTNDNVIGHTEWQDNYQARFGTNADFRIFHNNANAFMDNYTGHRYWRSYSHGSNLYIQGENNDGTNRAMIYADPDNSVNLYYAGTNRLSTTANGIAVNANGWGGITVTSNTANSYGHMYLKGTGGTSPAYADLGFADVGSSAVWSFSYRTSGRTLDAWYTPNGSSWIRPISFKTDGSVSTGGLIDFPSPGQTGTKTVKMGTWHNLGSPYMEVRFNGVAYGITLFASRRDMKKNFEPIENTINTEKIFDLIPLTFNWKTQEDGEPLSFGFIAEEVEKILPELVIYRENGEIQGLKYEMLSTLNLVELTKVRNTTKEYESRLPLLNIDNDGQIALTQTDSGSAQSYNVTIQNTPTNTLLGLADLVVARIRSGLINTQELVVEKTASITNLNVNTLKIGGQTLDERIASVVLGLSGSSGSTASGSGELVSPVVDATLGSLEVTNKTKLSQLLVTKDATFEGSLKTKTATITGTLSARESKLGALLAQNATVSGTLTANTITTETIQAATISAHSTRLAHLESKLAEFEQVKATTAEFMDATVSGTLYAENIMVRNKIVAGENKPSILEVTQEKLSGEAASSSASTTQTIYDTVASAGYEASSSADLNLTLADLTMSTDDVTLTAQAGFINEYFRVNGSAYVADSLGIGNQLLVGEGTTIADGSIGYTAPTGTEQVLKIQPSGKGTLSLMAGLMTLTEDGRVTINGDLHLAGSLEVEDTLLTNLIQPTDFGNPFQVQVAGVDASSGEVKESRFEIINELGSPVATISAEGRAEFASGIGVGAENLNSPSSTDSAEVESSKTSGRATLPANTREITIKSTKITENSLIYVTPVGSTQNQVLYVKSQQVDNPDTPENEGRFVVGFDESIGEGVNFNWWIVN